MIYVYYIFAALLIFLSYRSFRGGIAYYNFFKQELSKPLSSYTPFATVIAPCKGVDEGLENNLAALFSQDYPEYEVIFVVDSGNDSAVEVIQEISFKDARNTNLVIARRSTESSQKVENLREAVMHADAGSKVFVFVDSDARPSKDWLRRAASG